MSYVLEVLFMKHGGTKVRISFNSPVILTFAIICLISLALGELSDGKTTEMFFSVYRSSLTNQIGRAHV